MLRIKVTNQEVTLEEATALGNPLVANSKGEYECLFEFDPSWDGLTKTAIFLDTYYGEKYLGDAQPVDIKDARLLENDRCIIPANVLKKDSHLKIGVCGTKGDAIERPTIYTRSLYVNVGASCAESIPDPEPTIYLQLLDLIEKTNVPEGGYEGQVLTKKSDNDYDLVWGDAGGSGGVSTWERLRNKPFDTLNPNEMEVIDGSLGVKAIGKTKVTGLENSLTNLDTKIDDKQPKGDYALKSDIKKPYVKSDLPPEDKSTIWVDPNGECPTPTPTGTVDTEMSDTSENAVQNKVIKAYVDNLLGGIDALVGGGF